MAQQTRSDEAVDPLKTAGRVAVATALTATLAAGPVAPEVFHLPDPVPIVQTLDLGASQPADQPADHHADDHRSWKKVLKAAAIAFALLLAAGALAFGLLKGCVGSLVVPDPDVDDDGQVDVVQVVDGAEGAEAA